MQRLAHLCLIVGSIALASCRTASQPLSLDSDSQATVPSVLPVDASQLLIGGDELIVQTAGEWIIRHENGVEVREPSGYGSHSVQVVAINGNSRSMTPPITVLAGGEVVIAQKMCFVDVRERGNWQRSH